MLINQAFHGDVGKQGIPAGQNQALQQPPYPTIPIREGVDELEFLVEHRTGDQTGKSFI